VGSGLILETTFLIDLERELASRVDGPAQEFLRANETAPLFITFIVAGELAAGLPPSDRLRWEQYIAPFEVLQSTTDVAWECGRIQRFLRTNGMLIGANDLWIAATAVARGMPLVTRNVREFERVPGLAVVPYRTS
jgi:predicted nucleic acid-binding protein